VICHLDYLDDQLYEVENIMEGFRKAGLETVADEATMAFCKKHNVKLSVDTVATDLIEVINEGDVKFVVTNLSGEAGMKSFGIRRYATEKKIPCVNAYDTYQCFVDIINKPVVTEPLDVFDICKI